MTERTTTHRSEPAGSPPDGEPVTGPAQPAGSHRATVTPAGAETRPLAEQHQRADQERAEQHQGAEQHQRSDRQRAEQQRAEQQRAEQQRAEQQRAEQQRATEQARAAEQQRAADPTRETEPNRDAERTRDAEQARPAERRPQAEAQPHTALVAGPDLEAISRRWQDIQAGFVDAPQQAVQDADALVADLLDRVTEMFAAERRQLESQWSRGESVSTEDLRLNLQRYRSFFQRLLAVHH